MQILKKAEFSIAVDSLDGPYEDWSQIAVKLIIDYDRKSYEIIPPSLEVTTRCQLPKWVAMAILLAYEKAVTELYGTFKND